MKLSLSIAAAWMQGELHLLPHPQDVAHQAPAPVAASTEVSTYSIDTRTLVPGALFFAVSGERFDAHAFVPQAMEKGSVAAVVAESKLDDQLLRYPVIAVDDPLLALQRLAAAVRRHWSGTLIGLTGSAGKTTTKEMVATVLSAHHPTLKSADNLNNHFGVPLQLLRLEPEHRYAVIEMGMSNAGEIALLAKLAAPDWAVVTNVGMAHAQNFTDGIEGIARAKRELVDALHPETGIAFLNGDDPRVAAFAQSFPGRSILVGTGGQAQLRAQSIEGQGAGGLSFIAVATGSTQSPGTQAPVHLQLLGAQNTTNALLALAVGLQAGISLQQGADALATLTPGDRRGQLLHLDGAQLINDCYNSNPAALSAMVHTLMQLPAQRHIVIAGEMLELGPQSAALHADCGARAAQAGAQWVIGVQGHARELADAAAQAGAQALFFNDATQVRDWLHDNLQPGDAVLLKGSRGVGLERALPPL